MVYHLQQLLLLIIITIIITLHHPCHASLNCDQWPPTVAESTNERLAKDLEESFTHDLPLDTLYVRGSHNSFNFNDTTGTYSGCSVGCDAEPTQPYGTCICQGSKETPHNQKHNITVQFADFRVRQLEYDPHYNPADGRFYDRHGDYGGGADSLVNMYELRDLLLADVHAVAIVLIEERGRDFPFTLYDRSILCPIFVSPENPARCNDDSFDPANDDTPNRLLLLPADYINNNMSWPTPRQMVKSGHRLVIFSGRPGNNHADQWLSLGGYAFGKEYGLEHPGRRSARSSGWCEVKPNDEPSARGDPKSRFEYVASCHIVLSVVACIGQDCRGHGLDDYVTRVKTGKIRDCGKGTHIDSWDRERSLASSITFGDGYPIAMNTGTVYHGDCVVADANVYAYSPELSYRWRNNVACNDTTHYRACVNPANRTEWRLISHGGECEQAGHYVHSVPYNAVEHQALRNLAIAQHVQSYYVNVRGNIFGDYDCFGEPGTDHVACRRSHQQQRACTTTSCPRHDQWCVERDTLWTPAGYTCVDKQGGGDEGRTRPLPPPPPPPPEPEPPHPSNDGTSDNDHHRRTMVVIIVATTILVVVLFITVVLFVRWRQRRKKQEAYGLVIEMQEEDAQEQEQPTTS